MHLEEKIKDIANCNAKSKIFKKIKLTKFKFLSFMAELQTFRRGIETGCS